MAVSKRVRNPLWPDVSTPEGVEFGIGAGVFAIGWIALSYASGALYLFFTGTTFHGVRGGTVLLMAKVVVAIAAAFLTWRFYLTHSLGLAVTILLWVLVEGSAKILGTNLRSGGLFIIIWLLMAAINGTRAARAAKRSNAANSVATPVAD